jgi:hypothetical protein
MSLPILIKIVIAVASGIVVGLISLQIENLSSNHAGSRMVHEVLYSSVDKGEAN